MRIQGIPVDMFVVTCGPYVARFAYWEEVVIYTQELKRYGIDSQINTIIKFN